MNEEQIDRLLVIQEAAAWVVELPFQNSQIEAEFEQWIRGSPVNATEFAAILRLSMTLARLDRFESISGNDRIIDAKQCDE